MKLKQKLLTSQFVNLALKVATRLKFLFHSSNLDIVFVMPHSTTKGWILNAICREVAERCKGLNVALVHVDQPLPLAKAYFFSHYMFYRESLASLGAFRLGQSYLFATHLESEKHGVSDQEISRLINLVDGTFCMNKALRNHLANAGANESKMHVLVGAADSNTFLPHPRTKDGL
ncbi:MAG: hypothetical protein R3194_05635, partial [Limnobacter sp.]|nr:hypothetical protein [Limnobacter sp.]